MFSFSFLLPISLQPITVVAPKPTHHFLNDLYNIVDLGKGFRHFFFYWLHFTVAETEAWKDKVVFPKTCCYLEAGDNLKLRCSKFTPQMPFSLHEAASEYFRLFVTLWLHLLSILNPSVNSICFCSLTAYSIYSSFCTVWPQLVITYLCYRTAKVLKNLGWCLKLPGLLLPWTQSRMLVWYWHKYKKKKKKRCIFSQLKNNFKASYIMWHSLQVWRPQDWWYEIKKRGSLDPSFSQLLALFWQTFCHYCLAEELELVFLYQNYYLPWIIKINKVSSCVKPPDNLLSTNN